MSPGFISRVVVADKVAWLYAHPERVARSD